MLHSSTSSSPLQPSKRRKLQSHADPPTSRSSSASSASLASLVSLRSSTPATSCSPDPAQASTRPSQPAPLKHFLSWCKSQGVHIQPCLELCYSGNTVSWSISCHASTPIPADTLIATIPKTAVLSRKTSALSPLLKGKWLSQSHETVGLELALCLLYERCLGPKSRFQAFLSILPRLLVPLPFLRNPETQHSDHWRWILGTEADRIDRRAAYSLLASSSASVAWPYDHDYGMSKQKALDYFYTIGIPILSRSKLFDRTQREHLDGLESAFLTAYTHVSSRDFIIDTHHGVGLVPVADLFNHAEVHTVQFESDQHVCEICGIAFLTGHEEDECRFGITDREKVSRAADQVSPEGEESEETYEGVERNDESESEADENGQDEQEDAYADTLDMRTLSAISAGEEIYNTYGPLSNALLLTRYGFCLDTETDMERFTLDLRFPSERSTFFKAFISHPSSTFKRVSDVEDVFHKALSLVAAHFPKSEQDSEEDNEDQEILDARLDSEKNAMDALYRLEPLVPSPNWLSSAFCPLFHKSPPSNPDQVDEDLVDRDMINPLFVNSIGRTSLVLYSLIFLIHHLQYYPRKSHSHLDLGAIFSSAASQNNSMVQSTLQTLRSFCQYRLKSFYITDRLEEGLDLLQPDSDATNIERAAIQHAYQEHAALTSALIGLDELLTPKQTPTPHKFPTHSHTIPSCFVHE